MLCKYILDSVYIYDMVSSTIGHVVYNYNRIYVRLMPIDDMENLNNFSWVGFWPQKDYTKAHGIWQAKITPKKAKITTQPKKDHVHVHRIYVSNAAKGVWSFTKFTQPKFVYIGTTVKAAMSSTLHYQGLVATTPTKIAWCLYNAQKL